MVAATRIEPEIRTMKKQPVAVIPITTPIGGIGEAIGLAYQELDAVIRAEGGETAGMPFVRYFTFGPGAFELEAGMPVAGKIAPSGRVIMSRLPAGEAAVAVHVGPYDRLPETYDSLMAWLTQQGREPGGPMWEVYLTSPLAEPDTAAWRTEVFIPLR
jgi:AraC family transcriptional regulator